MCNDDICETDGILMIEDFCESKYSCFYDADCMMQPKETSESCESCDFPRTTNACYVKNEHMQSCDWQKPFVVHKSLSMNKYVWLIINSVEITV